MKSLVGSLWKVTRFVWNHPLNRADQLGAIGRLASWQAGSRLLRGPVILPFVDDTVLVMERGMTGATGNWYCGLHEHEEMLFVLRVLRPNDLFVDVGANIGSYTVLGAGVVGAQTVSFEPIPQTYKRLLRNIEVNHLAAKVEAHAIGVSDREGRLRFTDNLDTVNHVLNDVEKGPFTEIKVSTLDHVLAGRSPSLIKLDIEGHESAALRGAATILAQPSLLAVLLETNESGERYGVSHKEVTDVMAKAGFSPFQYLSDTNKLIPADAHCQNTIFIRDLESVRVRLAGARRFRLCNGEV
jgi:FkbM family methyltransferase